MINKQGRLAQTFASIREGASRWEEHPEKEVAAGVTDTSGTGEDMPAEGSEQRGLVPPVEPPPSLADDLLFDPARLEAPPSPSPEAQGGTAETDGSETDGEQPQADSPSEIVGGEVSDPWLVAGAVLRSTQAEPREGSEAVMAMIRKDIILQPDKAKVNQKNKAPQRTQSKNKAVPPSLAPSRIGQSQGLQRKASPSLPLLRLTGPALRSLHRVAAMAVTAAAITYVLAHLGFGGTRYVHFSVQAPTARAVAVVGDFNDWEAGKHPLRRLPGSTVWETWVDLKPGRYRYAFLIDGRVHMLDRSVENTFDESLQRSVSIVVVPRRGGGPEVVGDEEAAASGPLSSVSRQADNEQEGSR